jgi:hypothetical protein
MQVTGLRQKTSKEKKKTQTVVALVVVFLFGQRSSVAVKGGDKPGHQVQEDGAKQGLDACRGVIIPKQELS